MRQNEVFFSTIEMQLETIMLNGEKASSNNHMLYHFIYGELPNEEKGKESAK